MLRIPQNRQNGSILSDYVVYHTEKSEAEECPSRRLATCKSHRITKGEAVTRPGLGLALPCTCFHSQSCSDLLESCGFGTTAVSLSRETHCTAGSGVKTLGSDPAPAPQQLSDSEHRPQPPYEFPGAV